MTAQYVQVPNKFFAHQIEFFIGYSTVLLGVIAPFALVQEDFGWTLHLFKVVQATFGAPKILDWELVSESGAGWIIAIVWSFFEKSDCAIGVSVERQGVIE